MKLGLYSGAGNRFALIGPEVLRPGANFPALARAVCSERKLDGLLVAALPANGGDVKLLIFNADGTRPEACGNGLRCLALFARETGLVQQDRMIVETDAGPRAVELLREGGRIVGARAGMGRAEIEPDDRVLSSPWGELRGRCVRIGNPHFVLAVPDVERAQVNEWGPWIERHPSFPEGANVEFACPIRIESDGQASGAQPKALRLRVWERGVGETAACGTGACAAALALARESAAASAVTLHLPGGSLRVRLTPEAEVELEGPCRCDGAFEWKGPCA